jgi:murein DD-endopeptidase MepM/ murein hydrolase activator NlpD
MMARRLLQRGALAMVIALAGALAGTLFMTRPAAADPPAPFVLRPPVQPACVSSPFGWRHAVGPRAPAGFHNGIDLPAPAGAEVRAAAAGTVEVIRRHGPGGLWILVRHPDGLSTLYAHLGTLRARFASGQRRVAAGEVLGRVGRSGVTYGTHVFFAVFAEGRAVDPAPLLGVARCSR